MTSYIALLRAVNVGGTGKLPMADLRAMAEQAGLQDVRTYIQSGNLLCRFAGTAAEVQATMEAALAAYAGKPVGVVVRTGEEMAAILAANPFPEAAPNQLGVIFLDAAPAEDSLTQAKQHKDEKISLGAREIYIHYPAGMGQSKLRLPAQDTGTMRNLNTVSKLADMANER